MHGTVDLILLFLFVPITRSLFALIVKIAILSGFTALLPFMKGAVFPNALRKRRCATVNYSLFAIGSLPILNGNGLRSGRNAVSFLCVSVFVPKSLLNGFGRFIESSLTGLAGKTCGRLLIVLMSNGDIVIRVCNVARSQCFYAFLKSFDAVVGV